MSEQDHQKVERVVERVLWAWGVLALAYASFHFGRAIGYDDGMSQQVSHYRLHRDMDQQGQVKPK